MSDQILSQSAYTAVINAQIDWVAFADWLLNLPEGEYQRCAPPDHIAAGYTLPTTDAPCQSTSSRSARDIIQHYIGEITVPLSLRLELEIAEELRTSS